MGETRGGKGEEVRGSILIRTETGRRAGQVSGGNMLV